MSLHLVPRKPKQASSDPLLTKTEQPEKTRTMIEEGGCFDEMNGEGVPGEPLEAVSRFPGEKHNDQQPLVLPSSESHPKPESKIQYDSNPQLQTEDSVHPMEDCRFYKKNLTSSLSVAVDLGTSGCIHHLTLVLDGLPNDPSGFSEVLSGLLRHTAHLTLTSYLRCVSPELWFQVHNELSDLPHLQSLVRGAMVV